MAAHVRALLELQRRGAVVFDYGNNLRGQALKAGVDDAFKHRRIRAALHPPALLRGQGPVSLGRAVGRSGGHPGHRSGAASSSSRRTEPLARWLTPGRRSASRSRDCRRGSAGSATASAIAPGLLFNELVREGKLKAPIVIGRDHLDAGSVASPNRETEGMRDGSDAIADWPILNALLNTACGATWVSVHHGGGVGIGYSIHAGHGDRRRRDARGRSAAAARASSADPGTGVMRHADAGYPEADRRGTGARGGPALPSVSAGRPPAGLRREPDGARGGGSRRPPSAGVGRRLVLDSVRAAPGAAPSPELADGVRRRVARSCGARRGPFRAGPGGVPFAAGGGVVVDRPALFARRAPGPRRTLRRMLDRA